MMGIAARVLADHWKRSGREDGRPDYSADRRAVSTLLKEVEHMVVEVKPSNPSC